ncbi:MAG: DNA internalization-related competence protein ComEC/Rec2 [Deltaproteobacteria bacterium]|nr:DNA internalization-related competence protein ComEC/Rec2 [Deltaproteobacteria bacterium]
MHPLLPLLVAFLSGAVFSGLTVITRSTALLLAACSFAPLLLFYAKKRPFSPALIVPPFFFIGALFVIPYIRPEFPEEHIIHFARDSRSGEESPRSRSGTMAEGIVLEMPEFTGERTRLQVEAKRIEAGGVWRGTSGKVLLTVNGKADFDAGDRVRFTASLKEPYNYGNPGEFDYRMYLGLKSIFVTGFVKSPGLIVKLEGGGEGYIERERKRIRDFIDASGAENGAFLKALIIADKAEIGPSEREAFNKTGTAHILAISGLHVGIVALFSHSVILFFLKRSERLLLAFDVRKAALAASLIPVFLYGTIAGFPVSTVRAVIMVAVFVLTLYLNRGRDFLNTLALAALLILLVSPYSLWDISFQLSFAAVFSIIYLVPKLDAIFSKEKKEGEERAKKGLNARIRSVWTKKVKPSVLMTVAAGAGTSPLLAYHFHRVSLAGLAANLIVVPLTGIIVPVLLISSLISAFSVSLALVLLRLSDLIFKVLLWAVRWFASLPYSCIWVTTPTVPEIILFCAFLFFAANFKKYRRYGYAAALVLALLVADWGYYSYFKGSPELKVTFISVGQGDSELVETPGGKTMLIDGGGVWGGFDIGEKVLAPFLWYRKIKEIDYLVLSHAQRDHMAGLKFIAENFSIGEFWWNGEGELGELKRVLEKRRIPVRRLDGSAPWFTVGGVAVETLHPSGPADFDANNSCLVLRIVYGKTRFLFTGDIGLDAEGELQKREIRAEVLKAPHHGSRYSSSEGFLKAVNPSVIVISAGRHNVFRFPHQETLERYRSLGSKVLRTDIDGAVTVRSDGERLLEEAYLTGGSR